MVEQLVSTTPTRAVALGADQIRSSGSLLMGAVDATARAECHAVQVASAHCTETLSAAPTLLLIDAGLPDLQVLLAGVGAGVRPVLVGRDEDALDIVQRELQAAAFTAAGSPARLAIVAHGAAGAVLIGREPIERASLAARADQWASLGQGALQSIDLFACHAGADQGFVKAFAAVSGCAVAASRRAVGHGLLGADWQLDVVASPAESAASAAANGVVPFSRAACEAWGHSLATVAGAQGLAAGSYSLTDTAANLAAASTAIGNGATTIVATTAATVVEATKIENFTNTGSNTYDISDTAANLAASTNTVASKAANVTASTTATMGQANVIAGWTKSVVYSITDTAAQIAATTLGYISARNEAVNITATGTATVAEATTILNATNSGTNSFSISDTVAAVDGATTDLLNQATNITATGIATVAQATKIVNATNSGTNTFNISDTVAAVAAASVSVLNEAGKIILTGTTAAGDLNTLDARTTAPVDASAWTTLTGTVADVLAAYNSNGITGLGNEAVTLSGSTSVADANSVDGRTSGVVTATISQGDLTTLASLTGTGNAYTITLSDTTVAAAALNALIAKTTLKVNATSVTMLTGTAADTVRAYNFSNFINFSDV